jgi:hypothetical protein
VVRPGRAQVAVTRRNGGRWVCILVDGRQRHFELDRGLDPQQFPWLRAAGFRPLPPGRSRHSTSIYRSVAKRAMDYDRERGDRILILLCPREQWPELDLRWPPPDKTGQVASDKGQPE